MVLATIQTVLNETLSQRELAGVVEAAGRVAANVEGGVAEHGRVVQRERPCVPNAGPGVLRIAAGEAQRLQPDNAG